MEQEHADAYQMEQEHNESKMQKNMDTIDKKEELWTEYEAQRSSYQNTEWLRRSRRPNKPSKRYGYGKHIHTLVEYNQHSLKKRLKLFKENGTQALHKEINQLDYRNVVEPTSPEYKTKEDKTGTFNI